MKRSEFIKKLSLGTLGLAFLPAPVAALTKKEDEPPKPVFREYNGKEPLEIIICNLSDKPQKCIELFGAFCTRPADYANPSGCYIREDGQVCIYCMNKISYKDLLLQTMNWPIIVQKIKISADQRFYHGDMFFLEDRSDGYTATTSYILSRLITPYSTGKDLTAEFNFNFCINGFSSISLPQIYPGITKITLYPKKNENMIWHKRSQR